MSASPHHIHWFPIGLALLLAVLTGWLNDLARLPNVDDNAGFSHDPDAIVVDFRVLTFDQAGQPRSNLLARHMQHFMDDDTTELVEPSLEFFDPSRGARISSRRAMVSSSGENFYFLDRVRVEQHLPGSDQPVMLETEYLQVTPQGRVMQTDRAVVLRQGGSLVQAGGMYVDDRQKFLQLSGGVKGSYEIQP
jgi:lipopolysaccharide export system protein LptC